MADEAIRYGAGGVPYRPTTPAPEPEVEEEEVPTVSVKVTEKEGLGDIPKVKKNENI